jgi:hypothetical protein
VPQHRDAGLDERLDEGRPERAALDFDGIGAGLLQKASGVAHALGDGDLIGKKGHVADHEGVRRSARDGGGVVKHIVQRHRERGRIAEHRHAQRIADEDQGIPAASASWANA